MTVVNVTLTTIALRLTVGDLCLFYQYFHGYCSEEVASIIHSLKNSERETSCWYPMHSFRQPAVRGGFSYPYQPLSPRLIDISFVDANPQLCTNLPIGIWTLWSVHS